MSKNSTNIGTEKTAPAKPVMLLMIYPRNMTIKKTSSISTGVMVNPG
ncbi:MAG: hypothetical protein ABIC95_02140 [archaeon]